ncbi:LysR family transcriptional regulator [Aliamphritea spongicola]|uniref:LysR family transcriptional regulator n=1 Tax=Aliamphritea spongicola TaxID=707589 RepID=UPI00196A7FAA|nr:LysR family transcriptional regulator [Aliamphritea spongicola]MBN3563868.1 LysR family transcriptional regulator [Aliamphritea spongicola]
MADLHPRIFTTLVYFSACARHLSFTAAARELHITTGAVSQQIRKLETQLGFQLFIRQPDGIRLTQDGTKLQQVTDQAVGRINDVIHELQRSDHSELRLYSTPSLVFKWLIPKLRDFSLEYPRIKVSAFAETSLTNPDRQTGFDLLIDYRLNSDHCGQNTEKLMDEFIFPVASPAYLQGRDVSDKNFWNKVTLLHDDTPWRNAERDSEWRYWLAQTGRESVPGNSGHFFNRSDMAIAAACAGLGIAMARSTLVSDELQNGQLITPFETVKSNCSYYLSAPATGEHSSHQNGATLRDWLRRQATENNGKNV